MLQSHTVYSNVSKGVLAKTKDLVAAFGTDDQTKICLEVILVSIFYFFLKKKVILGYFLFVDWGFFWLLGGRFWRKGSYKLQGRKGNLNFQVSFGISPRLLCKRLSILKLNALTLLV